MGRDVYLLPFDGDGHGSSFSHTVLSVDRTLIVQTLFEALEGKGLVVPDHFNSFAGDDDPEHEEHTYGRTITDSYDVPLRYVLVSDLLPFGIDEGVWKCPRNRAIWAYLEALPPATKVALFWH